jgi:hypothetical protein
MCTWVGQALYNKNIGIMINNLQDDEKKSLMFDITQVLKE